MKRSTSIGALIVSLAAASTATAGPHDRDHGRDVHRGPPPRVIVHERHGAYYPPLGYYSHRWARGERLPRAYYARPFVINDYRAYRLHAPPRGYHWVRVDGDAILAAVATGIVLDTVFDAFD
jgi:Ni/Co efflux regulator RcnB